MRALTVIALAASFCFMPGGLSTLRAKDKDVLRVALILPRSPSTTLEMKRWDKRIKKATNDKLTLKVYYGGSAGDESAVIRKMRMGQVDASVVTTAGLSQFVRQALVLDAPGLFENYQQLDAVREALSPSFEEEAWKNGFKVLGWGDAGQLRFFSAKPIRTVTDIRKMRPWQWNENPVMKVFYDAVGVNGIPLELAEVYGGLQTNMIDMVIVSAVACMALQWHTKTKYVSAQGSGYVNGAFVISRKKFESMDEDVRDALVQISKNYNKSMVDRLRKTDKQAYTKLTERGIKPTRFEEEDKLRAIGKKMRKSMVGRIYSKDLLDKVEAIASANQ